MPAATSAPNASTRIASVIGSDRAPALPRSSPYAVSTALTPLASPNSPMKKPGEHAGQRRRSSGPARPCRPPWSCRRGSRTRRAPNARPPRSGAAFAEASGERTLRTSGALETRATTSSTAALKAGSLVRSERLWMRTLSPAGCLNPASRILSMRPDWPGPVVFGSASFVPTAPPMAKAITTKASQPNVAAFQ